MADSEETAVDETDGNEEDVDENGDISEYLS